MADRSVSVIGAIALLGVMVGGCASEGMVESSGTGSASDQTRGSSGMGSASSTTKNIDRVASGSVEDTLDACKGRIPKDASAGQKMLAEQSCRRDQAAR